MLPCSIFATKTSSAGVKVKVKYPDIILESYSGDIIKTMFPGTRTDRLKFKWHFRGENGMCYNVTGTWIQELGKHFFIDFDELKDFNGIFNWGNGKSQPIIYHFRVNCKSGTPNGTYTGIYQVSLSYN